MQPSTANRRPLPEMGRGASGSPAVAPGASFAKRDAEGLARRRKHRQPASRGESTRPASVALAAGKGRAHPPVLRNVNELPLQPDQSGARRNGKGAIVTFELNLEQLRKHAKERVRERRASGEEVKLAYVQFELARELGFPSGRS